MIEENFTTGDLGYQGRSLSTYDPGAEVWRQTRVGSSGGYLLFTGGSDGETLEMRTDMVDRDGRSVVSRMVFRDIGVDSLSWDWQSSEDGGETWTDRSNIAYRRVSMPEQG